MALFDFTTSLLATALIGHYMFRLDSVRSPGPPSSSPGSRLPFSCTSRSACRRCSDTTWA